MGLNERRRGVGGVCWSEAVSYVSGAAGARWAGTTSEGTASENHLVENATRSLLFRLTAVKRRHRPQRDRPAPTQHPIRLRPEGRHVEPVRLHTLSVPSARVASCPLPLPATTTAERLSCRERSRSRTYRHPHRDHVHPALRHHPLQRLRLPDHPPHRLPAPGPPARRLRGRDHRFAGVGARGVLEVEREGAGGVAGAAAEVEEGVEVGGGG